LADRESALVVVDSAFVVQEFDRSVHAQDVRATRNVIEVLGIVVNDVPRAYSNRLLAQLGATAETV
jgi:hypothetical protein